MTMQPYTSTQLAQDRRSLARLTRHDSRRAALRHLAAEVAIRALLPALAFAAIAALTHR